MIGQRLPEGAVYGTKQAINVQKFRAGRTDDLGLARPLFAVSVSAVTSLASTAVPATVPVAYSTLTLSALAASLFASPPCFLSLLLRPASSPTGYASSPQYVMFQATNLTIRY